MDQCFYVKPAFILFNVNESRPGSRMFRNEKLATILVWNGRDLIGANAPRLIDDFLFVHADQRPKNRQLRCLLNHCHIFQSL
jgi:hypothetical protein